MTLRRSEDNARTHTDAQYRPRQSEQRPSDELARAADSDATEGDESIEGDRPVPEAGDTSGVTRSKHPSTATQLTARSELDSLFGQDNAADFRRRWDVVQRSFVDDPQQAVRAGDELVTQVIQALSRTFAEQRMEFEKETNSDQPSTEILRLALQRYRSFFERLLAI